MDADLAILQTTQDYVRWRRQGALQKFTPPGFDLIRATLKDPKAHYLPVFLVMIGFAYNPAQIPEADAPRTIPDFLKPAFKGKIVSTYPHDDDLTLYSNTLIVEKYGWGMIERLLKQDMKFVRSHVLVSQETDKGERPVTFDQISQFNKVKFVVPDDLPMPVYPITTGIFANAPHPNAAKLFIAFVLSKEQQHRLTAAGAISVRPDVEPPPGLKPLSNYRIADGYISFISDEMRTKELRQRFEGYIGPPTALTSALLLILRRNRRAQTERQPKKVLRLSSPHGAQKRTQIPASGACGDAVRRYLRSMSATICSNSD